MSDQINKPSLSDSARRSSFSAPSSSTLKPVSDTFPPTRVTLSTRTDASPPPPAVQTPFGSPLYTGLNNSVSRGRDWESYTNTSPNKVQRQEQVSKARDQFLRNFEMPPSGSELSRGRSRAKFVQQLSLSTIYSVETCPAYTADTGSSETELELPRTPSDPSLSQSVDGAKLPDYIPTLENPFSTFPDLFFDDGLRKTVRLPPLVQKDPDDAGPSPYLPLQQADVDFYHSEEEVTIQPSHSIRTYLHPRPTFRTSLYLVDLRTLLIHCAVLQATITSLSQKPWSSPSPHSPQYYYEKMRCLTYQARECAERVQDRDLAARAEYWAGRACGGTRDYGAAVEHFRRALKLDVPNNYDETWTERLRGLRPSEKVDVKFLLDSCIRRHRSYLQRSEKMREYTDQRFQENGLPTHDYFNETPPMSPEWRPDRDRIVELANETYSTSDGKKQRRADRLGGNLEDKIDNQWEEENEDIRDMYRRQFSREEWRYIRHGNTEGREREESLEEVHGWSGEEESFGLNEDESEEGESKL